MASLNMDMTNVPTENPFEPVPAGEYEAMVTDSEMKRTKDGMGQYLSLTMEVQSGQFQGRKIFENLNLYHSNPKTVDIAQRSLSALCHAIGVLKVADSQDLHNRPFTIKVAVKDDPGYGLKNVIKGYKARDITAAAAPPFQGAPRAAAPAANPAFAAPPAQAKPPAAPWAHATA